MCTILVFNIHSFCDVDFPEAEEEFRSPGVVTVMKRNPDASRQRRRHFG